MSVKSTLTATVRAVKTGKFKHSKAPLTLTDSAVKQVKTLLARSSNTIGLRIGVRTRGCNGLSYTLDYAKERAKFDEVVEQDGVKVFIDSKAQLTLLGSEMDFVENELKSEFVFSNPNIKSTCGCGESFNM